MASEPQNDGSSGEVDYTSERVQHLEFIQAVVTRLAGNSATMKRYCIALVAIGMGIYKTIGEPQAFSALIVIVLAFWWLDARYLEDEKRFRRLYDIVRGEPQGMRPNFRLTPESQRSVTSLRDCLINWSTSPLYLPLITLLIVFWIAA
jgi:hypothetical protein